VSQLASPKALRIGTDARRENKTIVANRALVLEKVDIVILGWVSLLLGWVRSTGR